ncbi:hypothetical protein BKA56DRAFT_348048 [Ilyonectria sp. MPI-CAGE-AT-0026]|nr:hypothetical protein BKA56DRAFT_348048 [Ilyonectria sp. MPI-CAGE-AT-0026]
MRRYLAEARRPLLLPQLFGLCSLVLMRPAAFWHFGGSPQGIHPATIEGPPAINSSLCASYSVRPTSKPPYGYSPQGSTEKDA